MLLDLCVHVHECQYSLTFIPANRKRSPNAGVMLAHCLRRWPSITPTLGERLLFPGIICPVLTALRCLDLHDYDGRRLFDLHDCPAKPKWRSCTFEFCRNLLFLGLLGCSHLHVTWVYACAVSHRHVAIPPDSPTNTRRSTNVDFLLGQSWINIGSTSCFCWAA